MLWKNNGKIAPEITIGFMENIRLPRNTTFRITIPASCAFVDTLLRCKKVPGISRPSPKLSGYDPAKLSVSVKARTGRVDNVPVRISSFLSPSPAFKALQGSSFLSSLKLLCYFFAVPIFYLMHVKPLVNAATQRSISPVRGQKPAHESTARSDNRSAIHIGTWKGVSQTATGFLKTSNVSHIMSCLSTGIPSSSLLTPPCRLHAAFGDQCIVSRNFGDLCFPLLCVSPSGFRCPSQGAYECKTIQTNTELLVNAEVP